MSTAARSCAASPAWCAVSGSGFPMSMVGMVSWWGIMSDRSCTFSWDPVQSRAGPSTKSVHKRKQTVNPYEFYEWLENFSTFVATDFDWVGLRKGNIHHRKGLLLTVSELFLDLKCDSYRRFQGHMKDKILYQNLGLRVTVTLSRGTVR